MPHIANAVAAIDSLEFLSDTIPKTVTYKKLLDGSQNKLITPSLATPGSINHNNMSASAEPTNAASSSGSGSGSSSKLHGNGVSGVLDPDDDGDENYNGVDDYTMDVEHHRHHNSHHGYGGGGGSGGVTNGYPATSTSSSTNGHTGGVNGILARGGGGGMGRHEDEDDVMT